MKLDMGAAWNTATSLIGRNRDVVLVVAGVFFFLPSFAISLIMPQAAAMPMAESGDSEAMMAAVMSLYADYWWAILLSGVAQAIGTLALLTLLTDRARPTVGEAIKAGVVSFPSYFVSNLLVAFAIAIPVGLALVTSPLAIFLVMPIVVYLAIKFSLIMPAIAIDRILNPLGALARSWKLTKGNSLRLFLFFMLLFIATVVIFALVSMIFGVVFAAMGGEVEKIGNAVVSSAISAGFVVIFFAVLAGVHHQLAGDRPEQPAEIIE